jgi:tetrahydromethanopterin S-methyltransferase subunit B
MSVALAGAVGSETENLHRVQISMLEEKIERLEKLTTNHIPHLSGQMDGITDFFQSTTFKWGMAIVAVIAILYIIDKGDSKTKTSVGNKLIDLAMKKL